MTEEPLFVEGGERSLFGVLHHSESRGAEFGLVLCSPLFEEKLWAHRVFVNLARELSRRGTPVLRFDYMGNGDSDGDFEDATVETCLEDIRLATREVKERAGLAGGVGLLGLRFGATLAALAADRNPDYECLVLWEPILDGSMYMQELLRSNLATQLAVYKEVRQNRQKLVEIMHSGQLVNVDGYGLSAEMYDQACRIDLKDGIRSFEGPTLVVQVDRQEALPREGLRSFAETYRSGRLRAAVEQPFWREIPPYCPRADDLYRVTREWLAPGDTE